MTTEQQLKMITSLERAMDSLRLPYQLGMDVRAAIIKAKAAACPAIIPFRRLTPAEESKFRQWARKHYLLHTEISELWHPTVQDECRRLNAQDQNGNGMLHAGAPVPQAIRTMD